MENSAFFFIRALLQFVRCCFRLIGTATVSLRDLTRQGNNSKQVNVTLVDGQKRPTTVFLLFFCYD